MFLKRLDIIGFKSFPERIKLEFQPGLTAVVGPNGSGKSNIADAARWVMGEQSARSLRGAKMEDVIFSGTEFRKPLSYAEVVMTVDNASRTLPLEFNEVSVTRRVYRSGESEFALNGAACRLKDIQMLFMDTGVGREGYSIIGQGRIDEILSVRSEDRRMLFEEAAGIMKYKTRRAEALSKLEKEKQNLTRVNDLAEEIAAQLEPLEAQAERAKRWLSLKEQYKSVHINIFLDESRRIQSESEKLDAALFDLSAQSETGQSLLAEAQQAGLALKASAASADTDYKLANERLLEIVTEIEKNESAVKLARQRLEHGEADRGRLEAEILKRTESIEGKQAEGAKETALRQQKEWELQALEAKLSERQEDFQSLNEIVREREQALDGYNRAVMEQIAVSGDIRARLREAESLYERLGENKERINGEILHNETLLESENKNKNAAEKELSENTEASDKIKNSLDAYQRAREQLSAELQKLSADHRKAQASMQECQSKYKALSDLERHREGYSRSVKAVLRMGDDPRSGICGAVGELISVAKEYETAIEIALGGAAQNIVTRTEEDAKRAIEILKSSREGRATFLPLSSVKPRELDAARLGLDREPGFVGVASNLVTSDYPQVAGHLLGNVAVIDTMDNALRINKKYRYSHRLVTLDGELFTPGGAITGGSAARSGIIGRGRQLAELSETLERLKGEVSALEASVKTQADKLSATETYLSKMNGDAQALAIDYNNLRNRLGSSEEKIAALTKTAAACQQENTRVMGEIVQTNTAIRGIKKELSDQEQKIQETRAQMDEYRQAITNERGEKDEQLRELADIRVEISRKAESVNTSESMIKRLKGEQEILKAEQDALRIQRTSSKDSDQKLRAEIEASGKRLEALQNRREEQRNEITAIEEKKAALDAASERAEAETRVFMDDNARVERERDRLQLRKEQLDEESRRLHDEIWEEYSLTYQQAIAYKDAELSAASLRKEEKRLKAELSGLTDVNVGAVEAYKAVKTRYDFMTAQRDDILRAEKDLRGVADTLTGLMESRFSEQFTQISKHFSDVFREMFGGGKASLSLLDEKNVLESGIEITAQPPGKSLQTLLLLSGGERALTAIALLFAILRMKPSPFCILDEIEAALDDANVARFARFLRHYAKETQFIIITHRRGTMEAADTLYGVTMQEQGISKLVSVKLTEEDTKKETLQNG